MTHSITTLLSLVLAGFAFAASPVIPAAQRYKGGGPSTLRTFHGSEISTSSSSSTKSYAFTNWAGAFLNESDVTGITGTFIVPNPSPPAGSDPSMSYCGCAWVGLDGISNFCPNGGLIQAGVNWCINGAEGPSFVAWYEWWPAEAQQYWENVTISAGDSITVSINATSKSGGEAILINNSNGETATHTWTGQTPELCEVDAEWIVEDYSVGSDLVAFADYGAVTFTNNSAVVGLVTTRNLSNALLANMVSQNNSSDVISVSSVDGNNITCTYQ